MLEWAGSWEEVRGRTGPLIVEVPGRAGLYSNDAMRRAADANGSSGYGGGSELVWTAVKEAVALGLSDEEFALSCNERRGHGGGRPSAREPAWPRLPRCRRWH
jgi:hypothetical protein